MGVNIFKVMKKSLNLGLELARMVTSKLGQFFDIFIFLAYHSQKLIKPGRTLNNGMNLLKYGKFYMCIIPNIIKM